MEDRIAHGLFLFNTNILNVYITGGKYICLLYCLVNLRLTHVSYI
jgi:hypothetical protein